MNNSVDGDHELGHERDRVSVVEVIVILSHKGIAEEWECFILDAICIVMSLYISEREKIKLTVDY